MKAILMHRHGGSEVLTHGDAPDPKFRAGEVVVDVHAASINAADWQVRRGRSQPEIEFPHILSRDVSGAIGAVAPDVTGLEIDDAVFAVCAQGQEGAYAEKIAIDASIVVPKPHELSHLDSAAIR